MKREIRCPVVTGGKQCRKLIATIVDGGIIAETNRAGMSNTGWLPDRNALGLDCPKHEAVGEIPYEDGKLQTDQVTLYDRS